MTRHDGSATAVVTGASRGLGRAWSRALLGAGWTVVGDGRDAAALEAAAEQLGGRFVAVPGDVTDPSHRTTLRESVDSLGGRLDLLVHNAGALGPSPLPRLLDVDPATLRAVVEVNVVAPVALTAALRAPLLATGGTVVVVTSDAARSAYEGWGAYGLSKAALEHVVGTLAVEEPSLRVLALDPGDVRTAMHQAAFPGEDISDRADPDEVAPALLSLLRSPSPSGSRVTAGELLAGRAGVA